MRLEDLVAGVEGTRVHGDLSVEVSALAYDSREVTPGAVFFAVPGQRFDGRSFIPEALERGACAVVGPKGLPLTKGPTFIEADSVRRVMARMAARFYGDPSRELVLIGVTGTNGKTTFTYLMESILREAGYQPGVVGTISYRYGGREFGARNTTPESVDLQRLLREMADRGVTHCVLEVSSHGLDLFRVEGCRFSCAVFTVMGRDHLDHHGTMERYFAAKATLFTEVLPRSAREGRVAVINMDDPYGRRLIRMTPVRVLTVGAAPGADYRLASVNCTRQGTALEIHAPREVLRLRSPLLAEVNARNLLIAAATAHGLGVDAGAIVRGLEAVERIPGRLDRIRTDRGLLVLVDYAHTPDALDRTLASLRELTPGRLITVFGCGGDRDRGKRPLMGRAAARWSDLVVITSDNPRSESPAAIVEEIAAGIRAEGLALFEEPSELDRLENGSKAFGTVIDRREAIQTALSISREGDTVVIAGKGHEDVQVLGDRRVPFRDEEEVVRALRRIGDKESALA